MTIITTASAFSNISSLMSVAICAPTMAPITVGIARAVPFLKSSIFLPAEFGNRGHVLQDNSNAVGSVGNVCRQSHEHEKGKRYDRSASGKGIDEPNKNT